MMAERPLFTTRVRRGAWVRVDDPGGDGPLWFYGALWFYTARPERYAGEAMFEVPPQLALDDPR